MEENPTDDASDRRKVTHTRTIITTLTVGLVYSSHFLLNMSFIAILHDWTRHYSEWIGQRRLLQIPYVVTGVIAYGVFAVLFQKLPRKTCLYLVCGSQLITCIILCSVNSFWLLHLSRVFAAISGVGAGMMCVIYVSEIAPDDIRGGLVATHKLVYAFTEITPIVMYLSGMPMTALPLAITSIFISSVVTIWTYFGVPESPIYSLRLDDVARANQSLKLLRGDESCVSLEIANRKHVLKVTRSDNRSSTSIYQDCTNRRALMFIWVAILLYLTRIFAGFMVARFEVEAILWRFPKSANGYSHFLGIDIALIILGSVLAVVLCDHVGRKVLILISTFVCSLCFIGTGVCYVLEHYDHFVSTVHIINVVISFFYVLGFYLGISTLPEVVITDIFPPKILNSQIAILGSLHLCVDFLAHYVVYDAVDSIVLVWLFAGLSFLAAIVIFFFLPETKRRPPGFLLIDTEESVLFSSLQEEEEEP